MPETQVGYAVVGTVDFCLGLFENVLQDRNRLILWFEHPGVGVQIGAFPSLHDFLVGNDIAHHALMSDTWKRGVEVDQTVSQAARVARQALGAGEDALDDLVAERIIAFELIAVCLKFGLGFRELVFDWVLSVGRHHAIEGES